MGLRSLAPGEPGYVPRYEGDVWQSGHGLPPGDGMAVVNRSVYRSLGSGSWQTKLARKKFIDQLQNHLDQAGLGHVSEITDADPPHTPRGCPFQAWSLGELLLLDRVVLA